MLQDVKRGLLFTVVTMLLFGGAYPLALWGVGRIAFPGQAEGSLIRDAGGRAIGSRLIGQSFERPEYFHARPSAVDHNAASTGGTNHGPTNPGHLQAVRARLEAWIVREGVPAAHVASELVTASGSGLDPHISPQAAGIQIKRVAAARGVNESRVRDLVTRHTEPPALGFLGPPRVNVLLLNLALNRELGSGGAAAPAGGE